MVIWTTEFIHVIVSEKIVLRAIFEADVFDAPNQSFFYCLLL